jgi:hypothetical protein
MTHPNTTTTYTNHDITPPIWIQFKKQLKISNRVKKAHLLAIAKLQKGMGLAIVRSLEDTKGKLSRARLPIFPYTHNTRWNLYDTLKRSPRGVFHLQEP